MEQEVAHGLGLTLQNLFDQVIHNVTVVPSKRPDELADIVAPAR